MENSRSVSVSHCHCLFLSHILKMQFVYKLRNRQQQKSFLMNLFSLKNTCAHSAVRQHTHTHTHKCKHTHTHTHLRNASLLNKTTPEIEMCQTCNMNEIVDWNLYMYHLTEICLYFTLQGIRKQVFPLNTIPFPTATTPMPATEICDASTLPNFR